MDTKELVRWIGELEQSGELWRFYKGKDWVKLKEQILKEQHRECQVCLQEGRLTKADTVHHVNEVKERPDLALSKYFYDSEGTKQLNLIAICKRCHNKTHKRWRMKEPFNEEKW